jgi:hypothetical protein
MARPEITGQKIVVGSDAKHRPSDSGTKQRSRRRRPETPPACFSVASFCVAHHISQAFYYKLKSQGLTPREIQLGSRILITFESAADWRAERERAAATAAE